MWPGVPFRDTHHLSGAAVKMAEDRGCSLFDLMPEDLRTIHPLFADDVAEVPAASCQCQEDGIWISIFRQVTCNTRSSVSHRG